MARLIKNIKTYIKVFLSKIYYVYYNVIKNKNVNKNTALFIETHATSITFNYQSMINLLKKEGYEIKVVYANELNKNFASRILINFKVLNQISLHNFIFLNDGYQYLNYIKLRENQRVIQLWHASGAYKKFGYSLKDNEYGSKHDFSKFPLHTNYDLVSVSSEYVIPFYEEAMNTKNNVNALGSSRTDYYFDDINKEKAIEKFKLIINTTKKILLYAPTFRGRLGTDQFYPLDIDRLRNDISNDYIIIYKMHPYIKSHNLPVDNIFTFDLSDKFEFHELALIADICITDYSSVVFDWSLLNKPIGFYVYDLEEYENNRGLFMDFENFIPGPKLLNSEDIVEWLNLSKKDDTSLADFKAKFMGACDGNASNRILSWMKNS